MQKRREREKDLKTANKTNIDTRWGINRKIEWDEQQRRESSNDNWIRGGFLRTTNRDTDKNNNTNILRNLKIEGS